MNIISFIDSADDRMRRLNTRGKNTLDLLDRQYSGPLKSKLNRVDLLARYSEINSKIRAINSAVLALI